MGFGFNLIGFPLLLLATGGLVIYAIARQTWKPLLLFGPSSRISNQDDL
jgi:hypothetical protein